MTLPRSPGPDRRPFDTWGKALDDSDQAAGNTDGHVPYGKPVHVEVSADRAYVVLPAVQLRKFAWPVDVSGCRARIGPANA
jgi:hypothetical protein